MWIGKSTERDIQGLRIIGQIMKHKGTKTFRKRVGQSREGLFDFSQMTLKKANAEFMRMNYQSAYGKFFGRLPALMDLGDVQILRYKKFSEVPCTVILNSYAKTYLDSWQMLKDDPYYESMVLSSLRTLFTVVRGLEPHRTSMRETYARSEKQDQMSADRFD